MAEITEYGDVMLNVYVDEWGRRRINGLLEDGTKVVVVVVVVVETITANCFPMLYLTKPKTAEELISSVEGATLIDVAKDFPKYLLKKNKANELKSKFST